MCYQFRNDKLILYEIKETKRDWRCNQIWRKSKIDREAKEATIARSNKENTNNMLVLNFYWNKRKLQTLPWGWRKPHDKGANGGGDGGDDDEVMVRRWGRGGCAIDKSGLGRHAKFVINGKGEFDNKDVDAGTEFSGEDGAVFGEFETTINEGVDM